MSKIFTIFACANCGAQFPKWSGRCLECGQWGTLVEEIASSSKKDSQNPKLKLPKFIDLKSLKNSDLPRLKTGIAEADRVLGGGIMPGSLVLLSGEPGIGKSTIVAQIADAVQKSQDVVYVSGEESAFQVKGRFERLNIKPEKIKFLNETLIDKIIAAVESARPGVVIIDSIQTVYTSDIPSEPGGISQIRACAAKSLECAKKNNIAFFLIGHITKDGTIAGPKSLEHIVDTVIYLETEQTNDFRVLRAAKNRFGSVNELGVFEMTNQGFKEVPNPSGVFLDVRTGKLSGSVISCLMEGSRPFMVEVQALVSKTAFGYPQRKASGYDLNRLMVLIAVLTKRANINLSNQDVILNVVGGFRISDPALDLAVCLAISSSLLDQSLSRQMIVLGEVGLGGEIRNIKNLEQRLKEAEKLGFDKAIIPDAKISSQTMELVKVAKVAEVVRLF